MPSDRPSRPAGDLDAADLAQVATRAGRLATALVYAAVLAFPPRSARAEALPVDIAVNERAPISLLIIAPTKDIASTTRSEINRLAAAALENKTNLKLDLFDQGAIQDCEGKLTCFVEVVRSDYDLKKLALHREDSPGRLKHFSEIRVMLRSATPPPPRFLAIISSTRQADGSDRLIPVLIDTDDALSYIHEANERGKRGNLQEREALENKIAQFSVRASPPPKRVAAGQIDQFLRQLFLEEFRPELERAGSWEPYGQIALEIAQPGLEIELDSRRIGTTRPGGRTVIGAIMPGERTIRLFSPEFLPAERPVSVVRGKTALLSVNMQRQPKQLARATRTGMFWGGIATALIGAGVTAYAIKQASSPAWVPFCIRSAGEPCQGSSEFLRAGAPGAGDRVAPDQNPNGSSFFRLAPLGYSLAGMGLTWSATSALMGDQDSFPVLEIGLGVIVFVASMALSAAFDGKNEVCQAHPNCNAR